MSICRKYFKIVHGIRPLLTNKSLIAIGSTVQHFTLLLFNASLFCMGSGECFAIYVISIWGDTNLYRLSSPFNARNFWLLVTLLNFEKTSYRSLDLCLWLFSLKLLLASITLSRTIPNTAPPNSSCLISFSSFASTPSCTDCFSWL